MGTADLHWPALDPSDGLVIRVVIVTQTSLVHGS